MTKRLLASAAATFLLSLVVTCAENTRTPIEYEIPEGYAGWLIVVYGDEECPPLESRQGSRVVAFSSSGEACTSTEMELGFAVDKFFTVGDARNRLDLLDPRSSGSTSGVAIVGYEDGGKLKREYLFVGTVAEFRESTDEVGMPPAHILQGEQP